jgi:hypothetical protein
MSKEHSASCQQLVEDTGGLIVDGGELNKDLLFRIL